MKPRRLFEILGLVRAIAENPPRKGTIDVYKVGSVASSLQVHESRGGATRHHPSVSLRWFNENPD